MYELVLQILHIGDVNTNTIELASKSSGGLQKAEKECLEMAEKKVGRRA